MKTVLVQPQANFASESKLSLILQHLGWKIVHGGKADLKVWLSDEKQTDWTFINFRTIAIDKQWVTGAFHAVFGYPVGVDPVRHEGFCIRKDFGHGIHGTPIRCPAKRERGYCYQKLLTNDYGPKLMEEFRIDVYGEKFLNTRKILEKSPIGFPLASRRNASFEFNCGLKMFSDEECLRLWSLCFAIGLRFGSLDVIRHLDGKIYVIDATTNTSPPNMSWHKNTTLDHYLDVSADYFKRGLCPE